jgi:hypothetical protein
MLGILHKYFSGVHSFGRMLPKDLEMRRVPSAAKMDDNVPFQIADMAIVAIAH